MACPFGYSSPAESYTLLACTPTISRIMFLPLNVALILLVTMQALLLPLMLGRPVPVHDILMEDGCVVVQTCGRHRMWAWSPLPLIVQLSDTRHPLIEAKGGIFRAKVRHYDEVWLLDAATGAHVTESIECSRGSLRLRCRSTLLGASVGSLPVGPVALVLDTLAVSIIVVLLTHTRKTEEEVLPAFILGLAFCLMTSLSAYFCFWRASFLTPLARKRQHWRQKLLAGRDSNPSPVDSGPGRALAARKLCEFYTYFHETIRKRDMHYVAANLLNPLTEPEQLSYAELAGPVMVQWFVSHCCFPMIRME